MITFDQKKGLISVAKTPFSNGVISFETSSFKVNSTELDWQKSKSGFEAQSDKCLFAVNIKGTKVSISIKNIQKRNDIFLDNIFLRFQPEAQKTLLASDEWLEYINSASFMPECGVKKVGIGNRSLPPNPASSFAYVLCERRTKKSFIFAIQPENKGDYIEFKALHDSPHMEGNFGVEIKSIQQRSIKPGTKAESTTIKIEGGDDPLHLLEILGKEWKKADLKDIKRGWNSWDYFAGAVEADDIYKNRKAAKKLFGEKVKYFVIDEGYEPRWGEWDANWKFPKGLAYFCKKIKKDGGVPGIWTSALLVNSYLTMYREKPHWFALDKEGQPVIKSFSYGPMAFLDITHPEVEKFIFDTFRKLRNQGFEYFKVDFTQEVLNAHIFHDRTVPRANIIRKTFETIRKAIGKDAYLLACGAPFESVTGIVDASRISGDIHNFWGHIMRNSLNFATKWWMHRNLWNNDPDFLIVRTKETCSLSEMNRKYKPSPYSHEARNYWLAGREMNIREAQVYALSVYLTGGDIFLSDDLCSLNRKGVDMISKVLEMPLTKAAVPTDLFDSHEAIPSLWNAEEKDFTVLGVFNWEEDDTEFTINISEMGLKTRTGIKTFWTGKKVTPDKNGNITLDLPPRSCEGLIFK